MASLKHDPVTQVLATNVEEGIKKINEANLILLAEEESGAGLRDIDKALKENKHENQAVSDMFAKAEELRTAFKSALDDARNLYRTEVLKEEAKAPSAEVDKDKVKEERKIVLESIKLLVSYSQQNNKKDVLEWANSLEVPQVGRQGSSAVGQKKPRAYVSVNGTRHDSFGEAAKAASVLLSTEDNKVTVTSGDLVSAWSENGEKDNFDFQGLPVTVEEKSKK